MAANLIDLAVPGLGSALELLSKLYAKYSQLKEGVDLCISLHKRLTTFAEELKNVAPETLKAEHLLPRLQTLIEEYSKRVNEYAGERNFVKRVLGADKFAWDVKVFNERLDSIIAIISVKQTVRLIEWRSRFEVDSANMMSQLTGMGELQKEIWKAIKQLPTKKDVEEMALLVKRDLAVDGEPDPESTPQTPPALDPVMRRIVDVAERCFLDGKTVPNPPAWLIASDEVTTAEEPIDAEGLTQIFVGQWQGVQVAVKMFDVIGENPVFDKHFKVWRTLLHPHVAQLYGAGSSDGAPFFVFEYAHRESLDRCWSQSPQKELWRMLHQAALGLSYLHKKHLVHGNLSCSKLLVTEQGSVKLFGFGASYVRMNNKSNSIKPEVREEFAAPECIGINFNGKDCGIRHSPSFQSDVYSFGLTIVEAIGKKDPFVGMQSRGIRELKRTSRLCQPKEMNDEAWNLVQGMCTCDPAQRVSLAYVVEQLGRFGE